MKSEELMKMLKGPETLEEAKEMLKNNSSSKASIEQTAATSAILAILISKGICTIDEFKEAKEKYVEMMYEQTAQALLDMYKKEEAKEDE